MAWNVNQIYKYLLYQTRKNQSGGISATDLFYAWNSEQSALATDIIGRWQKENNSKEGQNTGLIENETIMSKIAILTKSVALPIVAGQGTKPTDFVYALSLRIGNYKVFPVTPDEISSANEDVIDGPSVANNTYLCTEYQNYYSFLPSTVTTFQLDYIQVPPDIVWDFTFDGAGRQVYNPAGATVQPIWDQATIVEITRRCLGSFGISLKDGDFAGAGSKIIQTGNI